MEVLTIILSITVGLAILTVGADIFVNAASEIALGFKVSPIAVGLTIVAFGTSAPELAVSILATTQENPDIAVGNVVGSNFFNIVFILGLCGLISPLSFPKQIIKFDLPLMLFSTILLWGVSRNLRIDFFDSLLFTLGILGYTLFQFKVSGQSPQNDINKPVTKKKTFIDSMRLLLGLSMLIGGAKLFVSGAVEGARLFNISEATIGLTIVAIGTSLPEVATSLIATLRGQRDIAIGNVVGSNIFNILAVLGISGLVSRDGIRVDPQIYRFDIPMMIVATLLTFLLALFFKKVTRSQGLLFLLFYVAYTFYLINM